MFKTTLFFIMTFMMCFQAGARSYVRNHEDFVHLSEYQKDQHIIKVMELVVELESKYNFETKKYGFSQERFEKFQKAVSTISNLLFQNAYAADPVSSQDWNGIASSFGLILNNPQVSENNRCIFAGWISETYISGGKTFCGHPSRSPRSSAGYPAPASGCGQNNKKIQCNPVIFGYKSASNHSLFCVSTDNNAENSSLQCMKKALGLVAEAGADDSADRLRTLRDNLSNNPEAFNSVQQFVYRTCVCETTHERFNSAYQSAIRPHRTCLGLMNMVGETVNCVEPRLPLQDRSIFENLRSQITQQNLSGRAADDFYEQFLSGLDRNSAEYRRVCQLPPVTPEVVNYICEKVTCPAGATQCDYEVKVAGQEGAELVSFSERPSEMPPAAGGTFPITFKVNNVSGTATCEVPETPATVEYQCEATCLVEAPATNGDGVTSTAEGADPAAEGTTTTAAGPTAAAATTPAQEVGCRITKLIKKPGDTAIPPVIVRAPVEEAQAEPRPLNFTLKIDNEDKQVPCLTTVTQITGTTTPADTTDDDGGEETTDGTDPTLTVKITDPGATAYTIEATTTNDTGWVFKWNSTPPEGKTIEKTWEAAVAENTTTTVAVAGDSGTEAEATTEADTTTEATAAETSHGKKITQKRYDFAYKVCGTLTKTGQEKKEGCVTVEKLGGAEKPGNKFPNVNPNLQPGGGSPRGTSDAAAIGIR